MTENDSLTLDDLSTEVARRLGETGLHRAQRDGRVSAAPDARTIRYYTTLGLLDAPTIIGRQARYTQRHVRQIMAIKALQGAALSLADIQARLYGRSDEELDALVAATAARPADPVRPVVWREIVIEPGLKLLASENWVPADDPTETERRVRAALAHLSSTSNTSREHSS